MTWRLAPLAGTLLLTGCMWADNTGLHEGVSPPNAGVALMNLEVLSVINTKKTIGDHVATWVTGKDCSTIRAQREGVWCVDWPGPPPPPQQVYCYASLAKPSCFSQPYTEGNDRLIGFVPAPTPIR
ncbi:MAG TPA: hypothetical protein VLL76_00715 [Candidatus Omnitrophota bacterium]|nr:hypothetical protein [Candidatus Omnitrophota bacterium]